FGYAEDEAGGQAFVALLVPDDRVSDAEKWIATAWASGSATCDSLQRTKDGNLVDVELVFRVLENAGLHGRVLAINIRDITQLRCTRQGKFLEARFRGLLEASLDAMIIIDPKGRIVLANEQTETLFGYRREALIGAPIEKLVPRGFHPPYLIRRAE